MYELIRNGAPRNILPKWELAYSPRNKLLDKIMNNTALNLTTDELILSTKYFTKRVDLERYMINSKSFAAVQFPDEYANMTELPLELNFSISFPSEMRIRDYGEYESKVETWMTSSIYTRNTELALGDLAGIPQANYVGEGFASLQLAITLNYIILSRKNNYSIDMLSLKKYAFRRISEKEFLNDSFHKYKLNSVSIIYYILNFASFLYVSNLLAHESRKTKHLEFAGFGMFIQMLSWIIALSFCYTAKNLIFSMSLKISLGRKYSSIFSHSSWYFIMVILMLFSLHMILFSFFISSIVHDTAHILFLSIFLYVLTYIPFAMNLMNINGSLVYRTVSSLFGNTSIGYFFQKLHTYQKLEIPCSWSSWFSNPYPFSGDIKPHAELMMIPSTLCFLIGYIYMYTLLAEPFGKRKKFYFIFTKSFWKPHRYNEKLNTFYVADQLSLNEHNNTPRIVGAFTIDLTKIKNGQNVVKKFSYKFYENEISVLFGSSVSGIKTILGMLIGAIKPSSGVAVISGYNIISDLETARKSLSICPGQIQVLFNHLTVQDHIKFYSMIRGVQKLKLDDEIAKYLPYLRYEKSIKVYPNQLSTGNKEKLAIVTSLCGNSKVVVIEKRSKFVDSFTQNEIWNILQQEKQCRTIILATNCMEEADAIGDTIGILIDGELRTSGSSFSIRKQFGNGYNLVSRENMFMLINSATVWLLTFSALNLNEQIETAITYTYL